MFDLDKKSLPKSNVMLQAFKGANHKRLQHQKIIRKKNIGKRVDLVTQLISGKQNTGNGVDLVYPIPPRVFLAQRMACHQWRNSN